MVHSPSSSDPAVKRRNLITLVVLLTFIGGMASLAYFNRHQFLSEFYDQR
jgi:hypothetical protein